MPVVDVDKFYGRKSVLELLKKRVLDFKDGYRQNVAFLGGRYSGKSIILQKFIADLEDDAIVPVYLNLENKDFPYFYHRIVGSLLFHYAKSRKLPVHEDLAFLIESTQSYLPQTHKLIKKIHSYLIHGKYLEFYSELIALPQLFAQETNKFCILVFDEFQCLEDLPVPEAFQELGKKIMTQKRCLYLMTSSHVGTAKEILSEKLSLLFGNFEVLHIDTFDLKTSQEFIAFHLKGLNIGEPLRNFLIDFTGGQPLSLQLICQELVSLAAIHAQGEIFMPLLTQALENVLFNPWGILARHYEILVSRLSEGKGNQSISAVLIALSEKRLKIKELTEQLGGKQAQMGQRINRLLEEGVVAKNGNFYYLQDRLFKYWLRFIFQKRWLSFDLDVYKHREQCRQELTQAFENFKVNAQKDISSRIIDLLYCFEDESYLFNGKRYKMPTFREIAPVKVRKNTGEYYDLIKASCADGDWLIVLKPENFCENDIAAIMAEQKKMQQKPQRCLLISLSSLDENARVRALQERMWIWNEGELNTLFNLYDKPYIV